jgi:hypothetical protein
MHRIKAAALSLLLLCPNFALGKSTLVTPEPQNGFSSESDPEWSEAHEHYHAGKAEHQAYHMKKRAEHNRWHQGAMEMDQEEFANAHRSYHQRMNRLHRRYHNVQMAGRGVLTAVPTIPSKHTAKSRVSQIYRMQRMEAVGGSRTLPATTEVRAFRSHSTVRRSHTPPPSKRSAREAVWSRRMAERAVF